MEGENGQPPDTLANDFAPRRCSFRCSPTPPPKTGGARWCVTFQNASQCSLAHPFLPLGRTPSDMVARFGGIAGPNKKNHPCSPFSRLLVDLLDQVRPLGPMVAVDVTNDFRSNTIGHFSF